MSEKTFRIPKFKVEHDGVEYEGELAKVEYYSIGREDHGIFTIRLGFEGDGWGQGISGMALQVSDKQENDGEAALWCLNYIIGMVDTLGSPEDAKGKQVVVFRSGKGGWGGMIKGFATVNPDGSYNKPFWNFDKEGK